MNKSELIEAIANEAGITTGQATKALSSLTENVSQALSDGKQIALPGFGTFSVSFRAARKGRNPRTGETIEIKASRVAKFKASKALKDVVDNNATA
jgi:DNA-binding protein HU-beta